MTSWLSDSVYIVTGATSGFGREIARQLVLHGAKVGVFGRREHRLAELVSEIGPDRAFSVAVDMRDAVEVTQACKKVKGAFGRIDGLVNNAGIAEPSLIEASEPESVQSQVDTNFIGIVNGCRAIIPLLDESSNPRIINISSATAHHYDEMAWLSVYAATKAAVERLSRDLRGEVQDRGIGVTVIRPGGVDTEFGAAWDPEVAGAALKAWHKHGPTMSTGMEVKHIAEAVLWCLNIDPGVSVDLMEIRPNRPVDKPS